MNADTALVKNLNNKDCMQLILGDCKSLAERFARINQADVRSEIKKAQNIEDQTPRMLTKFIRTVGS